MTKNTRGVRVLLLACWCQFSLWKTR